MRDGMPRAYLRIDPNIDQAYPELRSTFVGLMCAASRQPERGHFRTLSQAEALCGRAFVRRCVIRGDLVELPDGRWYIAGWDEWQEGDHTVAERMRRMRSRRNGRDAKVTKPASPDRNDVTTDAVLTSSTSLGDGVGDVSPPPRVGRRKDETNPRATGSNPRAKGTSPRQEREKQKRGPSSLHQILTAVAKNGSADD